jgi:hypothetical protein
MGLTPDFTVKRSGKESRIQESGVRRKEEPKSGSLPPFWILDSDSWILVFLNTTVISDSYYL